MLSELYKELNTLNKSLLIFVLINNSNRSKSFIANRLGISVPTVYKRYREANIALGKLRSISTKRDAFAFLTNDLVHNAKFVHKVLILTNGLYFIVNEGIVSIENTIYRSRFKNTWYAVGKSFRDSVYRGSPMYALTCAKELIDLAKRTKLPNCVDRASKIKAIYRSFTKDMNGKSLLVTAIIMLTSMTTTELAKLLGLTKVTIDNKLKAGKALVNGSYDLECKMLNILSAEDIIYLIREYPHES